MTTRHVSSENDYPFIPLLDTADGLVTAGILDVFFVIQGASSFIDTSSSSAAAPCTLNAVNFIQLTAYAVVGTTTTYTFRAQQRDRVWLITFDVPNDSASGTGQTNNTDGSDVQAVLIYNADKVIAAGSGSVSIEVEPGRAVWHTEQVDQIIFKNIARCAGVEDDTTLVAVDQFPNGEPLSTEIIIPFEDGYNTTVRYVKDALVFTGGTGFGRGLSPNLGDTVICDSSSSNSTFLSISANDLITTINGVRPVNGDIPIHVSQTLGKNQAVGILEIIAKQETV
jgi:hypothetical protein